MELGKPLIYICAQTILARTLVITLAAILLAVTAYLQISKQSIQIRGRTREQFPVLPIRGLLAAQNLSPVRNFILKSQFSEKVRYFRDFVKLFLATQNLSPTCNFILEVHITREMVRHISEFVKLYFVSKRNVILKEDVNLAKKSSSQKTSALGCSCCRRLCRCCRCCLLLTRAAEETPCNMEML